MPLPPQMKSRPTGNAYAPPHSGLASAIQMLASIHAGIPGKSIPREVMDFYKVMKNGDAFRPAILKEVVLTLEAQVTCGIADRRRLETAVRDRLKTVAARLNGHRLEQWLLADLRRERLIPCARYDWIDRLRAGYVAEGIEMFKVTMDYAAALVAGP